MGLSELSFFWKSAFLSDIYVGTPYLFKRDFKLSIETRELFESRTNISLVPIQFRNSILDNFCLAVPFLKTVNDDQSASAVGSVKERYSDEFDVVLSLLGVEVEIAAAAMFSVGSGEHLWVGTASRLLSFSIVALWLA